MIYLKLSTIYEILISFVMPSNFCQNPNMAFVQKKELGLGISFLHPIPKAKNFHFLMEQGFQRLERKNWAGKQLGNYVQTTILGIPQSNRL